MVRTLERSSTRHLLRPSTTTTAVTALVGLILLAGLAEGIVLLRIRVDPGQLAAFFVALSLILGVFVAFTDSRFVKQLRHWAAESKAKALGMPFALVIPYLVLSLGTETFSWRGLAKLAAYIAAPVALLFPDRGGRAVRAGWRDFAAMLALGVPVAANWLVGIWRWPEELYFFRPLYSVCVGAYAFMVIRNLDGVGYRLLWRKSDVWDGVTNFVAFSLLAVPVGLVLGFLHFNPHGVGLGEFLFRFFGIYLTIAIPEELLFRGILQNLLVRSIAQRRGVYGLLMASAIFGASHFHHPPVPNWRYVILATLAGLFYGNAYRTRQRISASALSHALVDTCWHYWF